MGRTSGMLLLALAMVLVAVAYVPSLPGSAATAAARKKGHRSGRKTPNKGASHAARDRAVKAQLSRARAEASVAQQMQAAAAGQAAAAQARAAQARSKVQAAADALKTARANAEAEAEYLKELEAEIEQSAGPDSPFGRATAQLEQAKKRMEAARQRVLSSPEYLAARDQAVRSGQNARLSEITSHALEADQAYQMAKMDWLEARKAVAKARQKLLEGNDEWKEATERARQARAALSRLQAQLRAGALEQAGANSRLRQAVKVGAAAQAAIEHAAAAANSLSRAQHKSSHKTRPNKKRRRPARGRKR